MSAQENMNKHLFDQNDKYTQNATHLDYVVGRKLKVIVEDYLKQGYHIREITHVMLLTIFDLELNVILDNDAIRRDREKQQE